ncbi:hypothetical protein HHI36_011335 [Cryptolaemus montrouzieri]|uniref:Endonuclease/exonuclease/phosphatase domain-containing protein n=1 Tax=Cryptolaemus montrouzieri TaxID=559131 RepID=A0ABD2MLU3_9CUCU
MSEEIFSKINEIFAKADKNGSELVLGDVNAKSCWWEAPVTDRSGLHIEWWIEQLGWVPTFVRDRSESHIDVTLSSPRAEPDKDEINERVGSPFTVPDPLTKEEMLKALDKEDFRA